ncbi:histone-lysine N-methyltransferase SMYD3 [Parasteatoda tepidariorum]|nr:histone-lysine N-methyltransferase SMYD3 [Parasteatoda tepidariorum]
MSGFVEGELIMSCEPYAHVLNNEFKGKFCDFCIKQNKGLKKCAQCSFSYYCDKNCQVKAWNLHKLECKFIKIFEGEKPYFLARLIALILLKIKKHGSDEPFVEVDGRKVSMASLMSHADDIKQDPVDSQTVKDLFITLQRYIGSSNMSSLEYLTEIYGKTVINSFSICHEMQSIGWGLYLGASIFDHSCDPNAVQIFDGTILSVRMRKNVPHRDLKQVYISYLNEILLTEERQKMLWEKYYFHCKCSCCTDPQRDYLMTRLLKDSFETKEEALKCEEAFKEKEKLFPALMDVNPKLVYDMCQILLKDQSKVLADTNIYRVRTLQFALDACLKLGALEDALTVASCLEEPIKLYLGVNNPSLGDFLFNYGKCLHTCGYRTAAVSKLSEAETIYKVAFGVQHPLYTYVKNALQFATLV